MKMNIFFFTALIVVLFSQMVIAEPEMVLVKGGCFQMGDTFGTGNEDERPVHKVCVDDFYIGKYEVTQREWEQLMRTNPSDFKHCKDCPVENVSWTDASEYIKKLSEKTGKQYRLPTEAEWEYAARSGGKKELWAGTSDDVKLGNYAWYRNNTDESTNPVGKKKPNGLGIYDMSGNVSEWVWDGYDKKYYETSPKDNPKAPLDEHENERVFRGGSWIGKPWALRTTNRDRDEPDLKDAVCGFRLALSIE